MPDFKLGTGPNFQLSPSLQPEQLECTQADDLSTYFGFVIGTGPNFQAAQQDANSQMWGDLAQICQSEGYTWVYLEILNEEPNGQTAPDRPSN